MLGNKSAVSAMNRVSPTRRSARSVRVNDSEQSISRFHQALAPSHIVPPIIPGHARKSGLRHASQSAPPHKSPAPFAALGRLGAQDRSF